PGTVSSAGRRTATRSVSWLERDGATGRRLSVFPGGSPPPHPRPASKPTSAARGGELDADRLLQVVEVERLGHVVGGPELEQPGGGLHVLVDRDHDDGQRRPAPG